MTPIRPPFVLSICFCAYGHNGTCLCMLHVYSVYMFFSFYPTALKGCRGIVFTHGVRMGGRAGGRAAGNSLSGLYLRNRKV